MGYSGSLNDRHLMSHSRRRTGHFMHKGKTPHFALHVECPVGLAWLLRRLTLKAAGIQAAIIVVYYACLVY